MKRIIVIGGGISGLAAAHRMLERTRETGSSVDVTLLEASSRLGGTVKTEERDGFLLERGPDSFISEKPQGLELAKRLDLESRLIQTNQANRRAFIVRNAKLLPVPEGFNLLAPSRLLPFLGSDIFSWRGKARMAMDVLLPRKYGSTRAANGADQENDESLADFVRRRLGREALERMAQPMVGGIFTADPERISLRATMPRFLEMERKHRSLILALRRNAIDPGSNPHGSRQTGEGGTSGARYSLFLSFDQGMQLLTDTVAKNISEVTDTSSSTARIRLNTRVESLQLTRENDQPVKWKLTTNAHETLQADEVCVALPAHTAAKLMRDVDIQLASELEGIPYASSATVNVAYKREDIPHPLDGFGFVVPFIEKRSIMACTFSSVKFAGRAPHNCVLLRAFVGGALQPEMFDLTEDQIVSRVLSDLHDLLGIERSPIFAEVSKWENSMPQYHLGHLARVERIRKRLGSLSGLALAGNAYTGPGIPDCIRSGEDAAEALLSDETLQNQAR
ncbi:MAG TPA: protoporphyrinogen oxidase [Pyrinomonadaceae bacterium]|nr:protoporphyrinogen oxidase [Pyrinomonadaceae bacterium]